jgi:hypothetical protein
LKHDVPVRQAVVVLAVLFLLACVPVWVVPYPPMVDYPMHVARAYLLSLPQDGQGITEYYQGKWAPIPNLGMDLIVSLMCRFLPALVAGKVFLCLIQLALLTGGFAFSVALSKRITYWSFFPAIALYDLWFMMGFANYLFGIGIAFWGAAVFLWSEDWPKSKRWWTLALFGIVLAVCHLMALAVAIGACVALSMKDRGKWTASVQMLTGSLALCVVAYLGLRLTGRVPVTFLDRYHVLKDALSVGGFLAIIGMSVLPRFLEPRAKPLIAGLAVFMIFGPSMLGGTAFACDRLTLPFFIAVLGAVRMGHYRTAGFQLVLVVGGLAYGMSERIGAWPAASQRSAEVVSALEEMSERSILASFDLGLRHQPNWRYQRHVADWILLDENVFVAQNFAKKNQQPMVFRPEYEDWHQYQQNNPVELDSWDQVAAELPVLQRMQSKPRTMIQGQPERVPDLYLLVFHTPEQRCTLTTDDRFSVAADDPEFTLLKVR